MSTHTPGTPKIFIFDTNVLLHDPEAIFKFDDNEVVLPIFVLEEVDNFKKDMGALGRNAREISRLLDEWREGHDGTLRGGVPLPDGGTLRVVLPDMEAEVDPNTSFFGESKKDNLILRQALQVQREHPDQQCILLTKDVNLRVRADALNLHAQNYEERAFTMNDLFSGACTAHVPGGLLTTLYQENSVELDLDAHTPTAEVITGGTIDVGRLFLNEYVVLKNEDGDQSAIGRVHGVREGGRIATLRPLDPQNKKAWGVQARNKEQAFALDALLDDSIQLVTLIGKAGTGKTLLAIAAALRKVTDDKRYDKAIVARPVIPMGRDIGFLPGTMEEKLTPWMRPIFDNVEYLMGLSTADKRKGRGAQEIIDMGILEIEALTYIRGRSIPNQFIIVDEAQNLTPHEAKTILTRVGEGTKIVLTGDPYQIDNPYVDSESNGLSYVLSRFKGESVAATITLHQGERSALAELAANLL